jgi:DNA-binding beta-propeller fold protein YncE
MRVPALLAALGLSACAEENQLSYATDEDASGYWDTGSAAPGAGEDGADFDDDGDEAPPETEEVPLLYKPAVTAKWLFVVNPGRDSLTRVEVDTLAVATAAVGSVPTTVATTADGAFAAVLNEGDDTVSVVDADAFTVTSVPIRDGNNRLDVSQSGDWAMCWYDPDWESSGTWEGVQSFNEVSFVQLDPPTSVPLVVGYKPHDVRWSKDGTRAVVVSDSMLAVVDLDIRPVAARLIPIAETEADAPVAEEVELTPDGHYAVVRQFGTSGLLAVNLESDEVVPLAVDGTPTDMDLDPSGDRLAVLVRSRHLVYRFEIDDLFAAPEEIPLPTDGEYGSLSFVGDDGLAVLSTNASLTPSLAVWDSEGGTLTERTLVKPVSAVGPVDATSSALIFHTREDQDGIDPDSPFRSKWALTMLDVVSLKATPLLLVDETSSWGATDDGHWAFVGLEEESRLEVLDLTTHLPEEVSLASPAMNVGALPGRSVGYASMEHELGRIGFYDAETGELDTLTGFELNSEIEH